MEQRTKGAWIVHHAGKIEAHGGRNLDNLRKAGNCGMLLSALSATQQTQLSTERVHVLAEAAGIDLTYQLPSLLDTLKKQALIDIGTGGVEVLGLTTRGVLEHTSSIFTGLSPRPREEACLEVAELCSGAPRTKAELSQFVGDQYKIAGKETAELMGVIETSKFCDAEKLDAATTVYFNGVLFRSGELKKTKAVLDSLTSADRAKINELEQRLKAEGCVEKTHAVQILGDSLFTKVQSIGMYDVSTVSNVRETIEYVTKPAAFNKFGRSDISDAFNLAKAFVASLEYGMNRSPAGRGRITFLRRLMEKLIAGQTVGPCTAIGQDYQVLELRGVVQVIPDGFRGYSMRLLKRDVGELALQVLESGDASEQSLDVLPGSPLSQYQGPEPNRVKARKKADLEGIDVRRALDTLRTQSM